MLLQLLKTNFDNFKSAANMPLNATNQTLGFFSKLISLLRLAAGRCASCYMRQYIEFNIKQNVINYTK